MVSAREITEKELVKLTRAGGLLGKDSYLSSSVLYSAYGGRSGYNRARRAFQTDIIESYVSDGAQLGRDGLAAFITAGPPGAGKSTAVSSLDLSSGYRLIDADKVKELLLEKAFLEGDYEKILNSKLPDGREILLNELSTLVHSESVDLANTIIQRSVEDGVNVVIAGTMNWPELRNRYLNWLVARDYRRLTIVDVEVDCMTAKERASERWWQGRKQAFDGSGSSLGGRFTPPDAIDCMYEPDSCASHCNENAVAMFNDSKTELFDELRLYVYDGIFGDREPDVYVAHDGVLDGEVPEALNQGRYRGLASPWEISSEET